MVDDDVARVPHCSVIKCARPARGIFTVELGLGRKEYVVCSEHDQRLSGGEEYRLDDSEHTIIMGQELTGLHEWQVSDYRVMYPVASPVANVELTVSRLGTGESRVIEFSVGPQVRQGLSQSLGPGPWDADS